VLAYFGLRRLSCLAVVCVLAACGSPPDDGVIDITYDPCTTALALDSPSAEQEDGIDVGLRLWNERAALVLNRSADIIDAPAVTVRFDEAAEAFHGVYDDERGIIFINESLSGHELAVTIAHELGHAFGLIHVKPSTRESLMNPSNVDIEPTEEDAEQLRALWGTCAP
jgi:Zn-dependent peptidase ImmA (M78 family)